ncbi:MAG: hypothetical protein FWE03_00165 [Firmicutes bacterium]|nr:hypothetical protein [Bacillota bacterium]
MQEVRSQSGKLVCRADGKSKTVEIVIKNEITLVRFTDDGQVVVVGKKSAA